MPLTLTLRTQLILLAILPLLMIGGTVWYALESLQKNNLALLLASRQQFYSRTWQTLVKAHGDQMGQFMEVIRQQKGLLQALKTTNRQQIVENSQSSWNQLNTKVAMLFFWNAGQVGEPLLAEFGSQGPVFAGYTSPLLAQVSETKQAAYAMERAPDGRLLLMQASAFFNAPGKPYNLAVVGVEPKALLTEMQRITGLTGVYLEAVDQNHTTRVVLDEQNQSVHFREQILDMAGQSVARLVLEDDLSTLFAEFSRAKRISVITPLLLMAVAGGLMLLFSSWLVKRIGHLTHTLNRLSAGEIQRRLAVTGQPDELDQVSQGVNTLATSLTHTMGNVYLQSETVTSLVEQLAKSTAHMAQDVGGCLTGNQEASQENSQLTGEITGIKESVAEATHNLGQIENTLHHLADQADTMAQSADQSLGHITQVTEAATHMTEQVAVVNASIQRTDDSMGVVAQAIGQINTSLDQVRQRSQAGRDQSRQVAQHAQNAREVMQHLNQTTREITKMVDMIKNIAEQTKMVALNAAIEASGAGEAGTGFAVVANEVKTLASQTAHATQLIYGKVSEILARTEEAVQAVSQVSRGIGQFTRAMESIDQTVTEQAGAVEAVHRSMGEVTEVSQTMTHKAQALDEAAHQVTRLAGSATAAMAEVSRTTGESVVLAQQAGQQAGDARQFVARILDSSRKTEGFAHTVGQRMAQSTRLVEGLQESVMHIRTITHLARKVSDDLFAAHIGMEWGAPRFDPRQAKDGHFQLLDDLAALLRGRPPVAREREPDADFDAWLVQHQDQLPQPALDSHASLHQLAQEIRTAVQAGDQTAARQRFAQLVRALAHFFVQVDQLFLTMEQDESRHIWQDNLSTGVAELDEDHHKLAMMLDQYREVLSVEHNAAMVMQVQLNLLHHARAHFAREEAYMARIQFPDLAEHRQQHREMLEQLKEMGMQSKTDPEAGGALMRLLLGWLHRHVRLWDSRYAQWAKEYPGTSQSQWSATFRSWFSLKWGQRPHWGKAGGGGLQTCQSPAGHITE